MAPQYLPPIHRAAWDGELEEVDRLLEADGHLLNASSSEEGGDGPRYTPVMLAARLSHEPVVKRLLALGANVKLQDRDGDTALHFACQAHKVGIAALLLDAGADINAQNRERHTPLIAASGRGSLECVQLLLARGGDALDLDVNLARRSALHYAVMNDRMEIVRLLLHSGANPHYIAFSLGTARFMGQGVYVDLLMAARAEPKRPRTLLKARALLDAGKAVEKARSDAGTQAAVAAAPVYLKGRVGEGRQLPQVEVGAAAKRRGKRGRRQLLQVAGGAADDEQQKEKVMACAKYALGLEGGGGWYEGEGPAPEEGMVKDVFVELCELLVPKWARNEM